MDVNKTVKRVAKKCIIRLMRLSWIKKLLIICTICITFLLVGVRFLAQTSRTIQRIFIDEAFIEDYEVFWSIKVDMTEQEVIKILGQPLEIYKATTSPVDYYVKGYSRKKREITNKVFIYITGETIAYIYFDDQNCVEDVFVGGS